MLGAAHFYVSKLLALPVTVGSFGCIYKIYVELQLGLGDILVLY